MTSIPIYPWQCDCDPPGKKTYNHMFTIAFSVPDSEFEDGEECIRQEVSKVITAALKRVANITEAAEWVEAAECNDTYCNEDFDTDSLAGKQVSYQVERVSIDGDGIRHIHANFEGYEDVPLVMNSANGFYPSQVEPGSNIKLYYNGLLLVKWELDR